MSEETKQTDSKNTGIEKAEQREQIVAEKTKGHHMDVGPGVLSVELPCGYIDSDGVLHREMAVREMTGHEEDIIAGKGPIVTRLNHVITNCTKQFGDIAERKDIAKAVSCLTAQDKMAVLIAIRRVSLGDFYDVTLNCPRDKCGESSHFTLDLSELEIIKMRDPMKRDREDELSTGRIISWHIMSAEDEGWLTKRQKKKEDILTLAMLARVDAIDGEKLVRGDGSAKSKKQYESALMALKNLTIRERSEIRELFRKEEGHVDTEVEFECPSCGYAWKAEMDITQNSFFFPLES